MTTTEYIEQLENLHARLLPKIKHLQWMMPMPSEDWKKAFYLYNLMNDGNLKMGCRPCYGKVVSFLNWYIKQLKKEME